jgi:hypothetical protein
MLMLPLSVVQTTDARASAGLVGTLESELFCSDSAKKSSHTSAETHCKDSESSPGATRVRRIRHASAS